MNAAAPTLAYLAMPMPDSRFGVFATSSASPEWYRLIALFHNKERADQYAEVEMMFLDDHDDMDGQWSAMQRAETANAPSAAEPPSAITVGSFVRRESVEIPAAPAPEEISLPANEIRALPPETASEEITPAPATPTPSAGEEIENVDDRPLVDAVTLAPLTSKQAEIFSALCRLSKSSDAVRARHIALETPYASVNDALYALEKKGFCAHRGEGDYVFYHPLASGAPNIEDAPKTGHKSTWTQEEIDGIALLDASKGDSYEAYGKKIGRSVNAVTSMAYSREIFRRELRYPEPVPAKADRAVAAPAKSNGHAISPAVAKELAKPAPVAPRGAPETRILAPVVRRVDLTKPRLPDANAERRMEILGDPAPGRSAADNDFDPKTYLIRKGHTVCLDFGGALRIDGKRYEGDEVIALVNSHRAKADLPPIVQGAA